MGVGAAWTAGGGAIEAPVAGWAAWGVAASETDPAAPVDVSFVEPMLRRRLSSLARMTLRVAYDCGHGLADLRFVYASRHGELGRTISLLESLADNEPLSPTVFGTSVLNSSAGLFSLLERDEAPATAISAGNESFGYGLIEACLQLAADPEHPVLFVYSDEPVPAVFGETDPALPAPHAVAVLLDASAKRRVRCAWSDGRRTSSDAAQSYAFLRALRSGCAAWQGERTAWHWETGQA